MSYSKSAHHSYSRMLDGDGNSISSTGGALNANVSGSVTATTSYTTSSVQVYALQGGSTKTAVECDSLGRVSTNATLQIQDADLTFGQTSMSASLPVVLASDQTAIDVTANGLDIRTLNTTDTVSAEIVVVPTVGAQNNLWDNGNPGPSGESNVIDCRYVKDISIFGINATGTTSFDIYVSQDNVTFYKTNLALSVSAGVAFYGAFTITARYVKLVTGTAQTNLYATLAGKA